MRANPILKKELVLGARSIKLSLALFFYSGILSVVALAFLESATSMDYYYGGMDFEVLLSVFMILAFLQLIMICIILPVLTAGSIAGERERQTLDILLTAPVSTFSIVAGKLFAAMANIFLFVISSLPAMGIAFLYGGIQWRYLFIFIVSIMCVAFFSGAIGIWCSSVYKKTTVSVIASMVVELLFFLGTISVIVGYIYWKYESAMNLQGAASVSSVNIGWAPLLLFLNPALGFADAIFTAYSGSSGAEMVLSNYLGRAVKVAPTLENLCPYWSWISMGLTIALGFCFMVFAARRIDMVRRKEKHMKVQKKEKKKRK